MTSATIRPAVASGHGDGPEPIQRIAVVETGVDGRLEIRVRSHRHLRGPFTAGAELVRIAAGRLRGNPVILAYAGALTALAPDLAVALPGAPKTLTNSAIERERTRYPSTSLARELANAAAAAIIELAERRPPGVRVIIHDLSDADASDVLMHEILAARAGDHPALAVEATDADPLPVPPGSEPRSWAAIRVAADGLPVDPLLEAAYVALDANERAGLHQRRALALHAAAVPGAQMGAIPFHVERGLDPHGEGVAALLQASNAAFAAGHYHAVVDLCRRGRPLAVGHEPESYRRFTHSLSVSLSYLGEAQESLALLDEERSLMRDPFHHMTAAYCYAMLHTRHLAPAERDSTVALAWSNTAIALADRLPEPDDRAIHGAFMRNACALVELSRGNLTGGLDLVDEAIAIADGYFPPDRHRLHRSVLHTNRARVLASLGRTEESRDEYTAVLTADPEYDELYFERAAVLRQLGEPTAAEADYDRAIELRPTCLEAFYNRADLMLEQGRISEALRDLARALELDPDFVPALLTRAEVLMDHGDTEAAGRDLAEALRLEPANPDLWAAEGARRAALPHADAASVAHEAFARALELDPDHIAALGNRAMLRFGDGDLTGSRDDLERAVAIAPSPALMDNLAIARAALAAGGTAPHAEPAATSP